MQIEQIYTGCLAQGAYYITSDGEAAIVDPLRETKPYTDKLQSDGVKLKYIFETHFHADFVSGHVDLANKTGASIVYGPTARPEFAFVSARDNEEFKVGRVTIKALHTPGHSMESTTYLLKDESGKDYCIFSGDTLFLGDVGRPDLAQIAANMTRDELAGLLYESLHSKIMPLGDHVIVYPAHGAGSACGKNMMKETVDTLGNQKRVNYALNQPDKAAFVKAVTGGLLPPPAYFGTTVVMNRKGYENFETVLNNGLRALSADLFEAAAERTGALILDTRKNTVFYKGFIPQSVNIGLDGDFAPWAGTLIIEAGQPILLVTDEDMEEEAVTRLSRVGFDNILGHIKGGYGAWLASGKKVDVVDRITAADFEKELAVGKDKVIDVRKESEYAVAHVQGAHCRPLAAINDWIRELDPEEHFFMHCAAGYRSMIASSILLARGHRNFTEVAGGFKSISETAIPLNSIA